MGILKVEDVTHWSIGVNDLEESENFYGELLGLTPLGRLGNSGLSCFGAGEHKILLAQREYPMDTSTHEDRGVHHSFTVRPETLVQACKVFREKNVRVDELIYRAVGVFTGKELYFFDPSGNRLELRDPTWEKGMPEPTIEEMARS